MASGGTEGKAGMGAWAAQEVLATQAATAAMEGLAALEDSAEMAASGHREPLAEMEAPAESAARVVPGFLLQPRSRFSIQAQSVAALAASQAWVGLAEPLEQTAPMGLVAREAMGDLPAWPEMAATAELAMLQIQMAARGGRVAMPALRELEEPEA